ncbi:MAG: pilus assembly protein TadE [Frankiales bacterium]|nr:pilus assembly protein TadE [Frankiales bacterium]
MRDEGSSTVEFTLVSVLLLGLFLAVLQLGFVLHTRNVLVASAQEGARYGANADRGTADARERTREVVSTALSTSVADRMRYEAEQVVRDGVVTVEVTVRGPLPLVFLPAGPLSLTVRGHALEEAR